MIEITQLDKIQRIVYMWARYSGVRTPKGKEYSSFAISQLIERLEKYRKNPKGFDWNEGEVEAEEND